MSAFLNYNQNEPISENGQGRMSLELIISWLIDSGCKVNESKTELCVFHKSRWEKITLKVSNCPVRVFMLTRVRLESVTRGKTIYGFHYGALTRLRYQRFEYRLQDEPRVGTNLESGPRFAKVWSDGQAGSVHTKYNCITVNDEKVSHCFFTRKTLVLLNF